MKLLEQINKIRAMGSVIYDRGISAELSTEQIHNTIQPLRESLEQIIKHYAKTNIKDCVLAIKSIENNNKALMDDIKYLKEKIEENKFYSDMIKKELIPYADNTQGFLEQDGFSVSLGGNGLSTR